MTPYRRAIDAIERITARSNLGLVAALKMRKFATAVISYAFYPDKTLDGSGEFALLRVAGPKIRTFMDVGANVGGWTAQLLLHAPSDATGFLYEPSKSAIERLDRRFGESNHLTIVSSAVGDKCGRGCL